MRIHVNILSRSALTLGIGLVMLPGCPLLSIEADVPEVCLSYPNLQVTSDKAVSSIKQTFVFDDLSAVHEFTDKLDANLEFVRAQVRATSGVDSFAFVQAMRVVVSSGDPDSDLPPLTMYDCDGDCVPDGNKLEIPASVGRDAIDYLRSDSIIIDLDFQGEIPATSWTMDVDVCMKARAGYTFSP
jgi:hypothetical protein